MVRIVAVSMALMWPLVNSGFALTDDPSSSQNRAGEDPRPVKIAVLGDSLTAGYGLAQRSSFPARLEAALGDQGFQVSVENGGVSGDTTAGGLARLEWTLASNPDIVIVELGANDGLRGLDPGQMERNLEEILLKLAERRIVPLLAGMRAPRNMGERYARSFDAVFPRLAETHDVLLYPFFLEGVAGVPELNQADGIHPNEQGIDEMVRRILPFVRRLVEGVLSERSG